MEFGRQYKFILGSLLGVLSQVLPAFRTLEHFVRVPMCSRCTSFSFTSRPFKSTSLKTSSSSSNSPSSENDDCGV